MPHDLKKLEGLRKLGSFMKAQKKLGILKVTTHLSTQKESFGQLCQKITKN